MQKPVDILNSTTPQIRLLIEKALIIEKDFQYIQNLETNKSLEKEISEKIAKMIEKEINE